MERRKRIDDCIKYGIIDACLEIAKYCQSLGLNVWCYTGYKMEELLNIDVLVDGPFILELKSYDVSFRGSSNQRIIDSKKSIIENKVCEIQK